MSYSPESRSSRKFEGISAINGLTNENRHNNPLYTCYNSSIGYNY